MNSLGSKVAPIFFLVGLGFIGISHLMCKNMVRSKHKNNIVIKFDGKGREIPADGQLLVIKCSLEDTIIVSPATDDDCMRILENHGKG